MFNCNGQECEEVYDENNNLIGCTSDDGIGDETGLIKCDVCEVHAGCIAKKVRD